MNLLILGSHAILEYDELRMFTDLGYDVFMPGGYQNPAEPREAMRPPVPNAPYHKDLARLCDGLRAMRGEPGPYIDWAKARLHPAIIDWADVIMVNCFPEAWIGGQWPSIKHKRVIWRTIGQSDPRLEQSMKQLQGLEIVRYSPAERRAFEPLGVFAGEDAVIRFAKYPADWYGWTGEEPVIGNLAQHGQIPHERAAFLNWAFFEEATRGLPVKFAGRNSEKLGGIGGLDYDAMRTYLRRIRCYLYTGTQPASYTLGLIEALMTGVPVISIGPEQMALPPLFEGHELAPWQALNAEAAHAWLEVTLKRPVDEAWDTGASPLRESESIRAKAIETFGVETIGPQWLDYLGAPKPAPALEAVAA